VRVRLRELTPPGTGAISVLEVSGPAALERLSRQFPGKRLSPGRVVLLRLACGGEELDEALVWCESDVRAEVHVHGSPPLVKRLLAEFARAGFDTELPAGPRTLEERALERVPLAPTAAGARMLLDQAEGALRREVLRLLDLPFEERKAGLSLLALRARRARTLLEGARVVLAGVVNAGKSTLFNALVGSERALVTPEAGTTRDLVIERAHLGHWPVWLCDTAGERALEPQESGARVEAAGQELGRRARGAADLVLWLVPADAASGPAAPAGALVVVTRADLVPPERLKHVPLWVRAGPDPRDAAERVTQAILEALGLPARAWEPGAAVPFESWMVAALEQALRDEDAGVLERLLESRP
jgi:tRNA modification GTPase